jgi:hypothetical protein
MEPGFHGGIAMSRHLKIAVGQYSDKGRKELNQDFHGVFVPKEPQLSSRRYLPGSRSQCS